MLSMLVLLADEGAAAKGGGPAAFDLLFFLAIPLLFYLVIIRPGMRKEKERQLLLTGMKKNDKVITSAGIYGTVIAVSEKEDEVTIKVDDNVRLKMTKGSIVRNLTNEEAAKAAKEPKAQPKEGEA